MMSRRLLSCLLPLLLVGLLALPAFAGRQDGAAKVKLNKLQNMVAKKPAAPAKTVEVEMKNELMNRTTPGMECSSFHHCKGCVSIHYCSWSTVKNFCLETVKATLDLGPCQSCEAPTAAVPVVVVEPAPVDDGPTPNLAYYEPVVADNVIRSPQPEDPPRPAGAQCVDGFGCSLPKPQHDLEDSEIDNLAGDVVTADAVDADSPALSAKVTIDETAPVVQPTAAPVAVAVATAAPTAHPTVEPEYAEATEAPLVLSDEVAEFVSKLQRRLQELQIRITGIEESLRHHAEGGDDDDDDKEDDEDDDDEHDKVHDDEEEEESEDDEHEDSDSDEPTEEPTEESTEEPTEEATADPETQTAGNATHAARKEAIRVIHKEILGHIQDSKKSIQDLLKEVSDALASTKAAKDGTTEPPTEENTQEEAEEVTTEATAAPTAEPTQAVETVDDETVQGTADASTGDDVDHFHEDIPGHEDDEIIIPAQGLVFTSSSPIRYNMLEQGSAKDASAKVAPAPKAQAQTQTQTQAKGAKVVTGKAEGFEPTYSD